MSAETTHQNLCHMLKDDEVCIPFFQIEKKYKHIYIITTKESLETKIEVVNDIVNSATKKHNMKALVSFKKEQIDKYDKRTLMIHKTAQSEEFKDWCESCVDYLLLRLVILDKKIECIDKTLLDMIQTLPNVVTETISF